MTRAAAKCLAAALALYGAACTSDPGELPAPGHLALFVDTDAPLPSPPGTVRDRRAPAPLFDTLRIEVYPSGATEPCSSCSREFDANEAMFRAGASITIETPLPKSGARARVRLYRSASVDNDAISPDSTIDVLVALPPQPSEGKHAITVFLPTDAVGRPVGSLAAPAAPIDGSPRASRVGTWPGAARKDCAEPPGPEEVCIPSGAFWMGNPLAFSANPDAAADRQRLVVLSPFYLDRHEATVATLRSSGLAFSSTDVYPYNPTPSTKDDSNWCTFTMVASDRDAMPVNCITYAMAQTYCRTVRGGDLPTLAELEYAGGGLASNTYVWGQDDPTCDDAIWGRAGVGFFIDNPGNCRTDAIGGPVRGPSGDDAAWKSPPRARDWLDVPTGSVFDLAGSVSEWARDRHNRQDEPCWIKPESNVFVDPVCDTIGSAGDQRSVFGGEWSEAGAFLRAALRNLARPSTMSSALGFRCARAAVAHP